MSNNNFPFTRPNYNNPLEETYTVVPPFGSFCSVEPLGSSAFEIAIRNGHTKYTYKADPGEPTPAMYDGVAPPHSMAPDDEENISVLLKKIQSKLNRELGKTHCLTYDFATNKWSYRTSLE